MTRQSTGRRWFIPTGVVWSPSNLTLPVLIIAGIAILAMLARIIAHIPPYGG